MKTEITKEDIGKIFKRTQKGCNPAYIHIEGVGDSTKEGFYFCSFFQFRGLIYPVKQWNIPAYYHYEEVSKLEVLVLFGVKI